MSLIEKLTRLQTKNKLSDKDMAATLNISRQLWQLYRTKPCKLQPPSIFKGILLHHPEMESDLIKFLKGDSSENNL